MIEFNPEGQLVQARKDNPALDAAYNRAEKEKQKYLEPIVEYFTALEEEIANMTIAQRFSRDHGVNRSFDIGPGIPNPALSGLNEAEHKRMQLSLNVQTVKGIAMRLIGQVEAIVLDMEAAKTD